MSNMFSQWVAEAETEFHWIFCGSCNMWLNGPTQWSDHLTGENHKKNILAARFELARAPAGEAGAL